jgi:carbon monoxide dehydrogenase subunit G
LLGAAGRAIIWIGDESLKIEGTYTIAAPRERVYATLRDPAALQQCIPGCQELVLQPDGRYLARLQVGIAAVKGTFSGHVQIADERPPEGYRLVVEGSGGPGFVKGEATITLHEIPEGTRVEVNADGQVGGMIAAVGQRVLLPAARALMNQFFGSMQKRIESEAG